MRGRDGESARRLADEARRAGTACSRHCVRRGLAGSRGADSTSRVGSGLGVYSSPSRGLLAGVEPVADEEVFVGTVGLSPSMAVSGVEQLFADLGGAAGCGGPFLPGGGVEAHGVGWSWSSVVDVHG